MEEVLSIFNNLENKNSSGYDDISNKLLKSIKEEVCTPLTVIINTSILNGILHDALKIAIVKPLFTKGKQNCFNNYRPISLLPTISNIFERAIYSQLYNYFNKINLLAEQQYGFRPQHFTALATIKLIDSILSYLDDKQNIKTHVALFLDLSKAFDTLDFDILLTNLQYYGLSYNALDLIKSYLLHCFQRVKYKNTQSNLIEIKTGIPQGSILGPLFFSIYINDIVKTSTKFSYLRYADDTTIYFYLEDFLAIEREIYINTKLNKIDSWLKLNKLTINVDKSKTMLFHKRRKVNTINIKKDLQTIERVSQFSFLCIMIEENLTWKNHVNMITNKLSKIIGILHRLTYIYPTHILLTIYNSLFIPHVNFGSLVWGTTIECISKLQKKMQYAQKHTTIILHILTSFERINSAEYVRYLFS